MHNGALPLVATQHTVSPTADLSSEVLQQCETLEDIGMACNIAPSVLVAVITELGGADDVSDVANMTPEEVLDALQRTGEDDHPLVRSRLRKWHRAIRRKAAWTPLPIPPMVEPLAATPRPTSERRVKLSTHSSTPPTTATCCRSART